MNGSLLKKMILLSMQALLDTTAYCSEDDSEKFDAGKAEIAPWCGKYCMSFFAKTRTAATVGKGKLSVTLKLQHYDWDQVMTGDGSYHNRTSGQEKERLTTTLCAKYGWAENHHIALGVPYWFNDFDISSSNDSQGLSNIYVFEKWRIIEETNNTLAMAIDFWYYFPNGESDKKLGKDESSYKISTEVSKAWMNCSLHFNPCYTWSEDKDSETGEINGGLIWKTYENLWPAVEYNYTDKEHQGHSHDIVPGFICNFSKSGAFRLGVPINIDSTFTDRDEFGIVLKLTHKW